MPNDDAVPLTVNVKKWSCHDKRGLFCVVHYANRPHDSVIKPLTDKTFNTIMRAVDVRQSQTDLCHRLDAICAKVPSDFDPAQHGAHNCCYSMFTNVTRFKCKTSVSVSSGDGDHTVVAGPRRLSVAPLESGNARGNPRTCRSLSTSRRSASSTLLFPVRCIFCNKGPRMRSGKYEKLIKCVTRDSEANIKSAADNKNDFKLLGKVQGVDLLAREAYYHELCRVAYVRRRPSCESVVNEVRSAEKIAYDNAFDHICKYVHVTVIGEKKAERMTMLLERYLLYIQQYAPKYYNASYKSQRLKEQLADHFGSKLEFWQPKSMRSCLVYSAELVIGEVVESAVEAACSESKILQEAALILRRHIETAFRNCPTMPWPPGIDDLTANSAGTPDSLNEFLTLMISGKKCSNVCEKTARVSRSIGQDLCSAVTRSRWKMPKHQLLGMTLHTITRRADVVTLLNHYGHCQSYNGTLDMENAIANEVQEEDTILPSNITSEGNDVVHCCFDNFDVNEETPTGAGTTHSTHGIVIQQVKSTIENLVDVNNHEQSTPLASTSSSAGQGKPTNAAKKFKYKPLHVPPCYTKKRGEPHIPLQDVTLALPVAGPDVSTEILWTVCRALHNEEHTVPEWSGWVSKTTAVSDELKVSQVGYLKPILHSITESSTVQKCLVIAQEVSAKLNQRHVLVTMDLAAAKIAYDVIIGSGEQFNNVILNLGPFHIMCSFMGALGKLMTGSGFEDIVIESGLCASGSIQQVMNGKHYNRAMRVHQHMLDALQRQLLTAFGKHSGVQLNSETLERLAKEPSSATVAAAGEAAEIQQFVVAFETFKDDVRHGKHGKTAQFWLQYCDCAWLLFTFQRAVKQNDFELYVSCLRRLCDLLFAADHQHYARYLPLYYCQLKSLSSSDPEAVALFARGGFSVARSRIPGCRNPVDLTIEQTINRSAKTPGGIVGFSRNPSAYSRWCITRHKRAEIVDATMRDAGFSVAGNDIHQTCRPSHIKRSERDVGKILTTFLQFSDPFGVDLSAKPDLFCLSSGKSASEKVATDLLRYVENGHSAAEVFITTRLVERTTPFQAGMKRMQLQTFQAMAVKCSVTSASRKTVQVKAERNLLGRLLMLSQKNEQEISMDKVFQYPLGPVPWALATSDGSLVKTDKSQLMHVLEKLVLAPDNSEGETTYGTYVLDGNAHFQSLTHLPATFEDLAYQLFCTFPKAPVVHFVTDTYRDKSIKQLERDRRGTAASYHVSGAKTKLPRDFKNFLMSGENKRQLINLLLTEWQTDRYAPLLDHRLLYVVSEDYCYLLQTIDKQKVTVTVIDELTSDQEEADTRLVLHSLFADRATTRGTGTSIVIRSPDTDVFILLTHYAHCFSNAVVFDTGNGNKRRLVDMKAVAAAVGPDVAAALPGFHAFTGCDTTSAFVRRGKNRPFKLLQDKREYCAIFKQLGEQVMQLTEDNEKVSSLSVETHKDLEKFVCAMYGQPSYRDPDKVRCDIFQSRYERRSTSNPLTVSTGIDLSLLPPCKSSLRMHSLRANYQAFIWKNAHVAVVGVPSADGLGWKELDDDGKSLGIEWTRGSCMPEALIDILVTDSDEVCNIPASVGVTYGEEEVDVAQDVDEWQEVVEEDEIDNIVDAIFDKDDSDDDDDFVDF